MAGFVPISGPVLADTVYINNVLVARDVSLTLPEVSPMTADVQAMGTWTMPVWQLLENLEASITKVGLDKGLISMIKAEPMSIECRIAQSITDANGVTKTIGCKAFMRGIPNKIPGISVADVNALL